MNSNLDKIAVLDRIKEFYNLEKKIDLANFLDISPNTLSNWYTRDTFDIDIIYTKCVGVDFNWLFNGEESNFLKGQNYVKIFNRIFEEILPETGLTYQELGEFCGIDKERMEFIFHRQQNMNEKDISQIVSKLNLVPSWVINGYGEKYIDKSFNPQNIRNEYKNSKNKITPSINKKFNGSPYYNVDFIGGFDLVMNDQTINPDYYINYPPYNKEGVVWCNLTGRSMEPEISNGDIIALKPMTSPIQYLPTGEIYAIITEDYRTVKRIKMSDREGFVRLIPSNKEFQEQEIPISMITRVYAVLGSIRKFF